VAEKDGLDGPNTHRDHLHSIHDSRLLFRYAIERGGMVHASQIKQITRHVGSTICDRSRHRCVHLDHPDISCLEFDHVVEEENRSYPNLLVWGLVCIFPIERTQMQAC
jgi:hypothetical protein